MGGEVGENNELRVVQAWPIKHTAFPTLLHSEAFKLESCPGVEMLMPHLRQT